MSLAAGDSFVTWFGQANDLVGKILTRFHEIRINKVPTSSWKSDF